jgi:hypothetical protein
METEQPDTSKKGIVVKVIDQETLVINRGSNHGLKNGNRYLIYGSGGEIKDPTTGASLGNLEIVRGSGTVIHVQEQIATIRSDRFHSPSTVVKRTIRKGGGSALAFALGGSESTEITEEERGEASRLPFEKPAVGDQAKPI